MSKNFNFMLGVTWVFKPEIDTGLHNQVFIIYLHSRLKVRLTHKALLLHTYNRRTIVSLWSGASQHRKRFFSLSNFANTQFDQLLDGWPLIWAVVMIECFFLLIKKMCFKLVSKVWNVWNYNQNIFDLSFHTQIYFQR